MAYVILYAESARRWAGKHDEFSSALRAYARGRLPGFATPEWVVVVKELPVRPIIYACHCVCCRAETAHSNSENVNRKDNEDGLAQTGCFRKVIINMRRTI